MREVARIKCPCCGGVFVVYESTDATTCGQTAIAVVPRGERTAADGE